VSTRQKQERAANEVVVGQEPLVRILQAVCERLGELESGVGEIRKLVGAGGSSRAWFSTGEFANEVGRADFTVRHWCARGRLAAEKLTNGREWRISAEEMARYRREGLRPLTDICD
jgi:hypothetical protein